MREGDAKEFTRNLEDLLLSGGEQCSESDADNRASLLLSRSKSPRSTSPSEPGTLGLNCC